MNKQTDIQKTLNILKERGDRGAHSFELNHLVGTTRIAARIQDLKYLGYAIESKPEKFGSSVGVRYTLFDSSKPQTDSKKYKWEFDRRTNTARRVEI